MPANYNNVNAVWPTDCPVPTGQEAISAVKRLVRLAYNFATKEHGWPKSASRVPKRKYRLTSGKRHTEIRNGVWFVNPNSYGGGWKFLVHDVSHWADRKFWRVTKGHSPRHAYIERMMAEHVIKSGWLDGKLKRPGKNPVVIDKKKVRYERALSKIKTWEAKQRRAENAIKKLMTQRRYYERTLTA